MRNILLVAGVFGLVGFSACSGDDHAGAIPEMSNSGRSNVGGSKGMNVGGDGGSNEGGAAGGSVTKPKPEAGGEGGAGGAGGADAGPPPTVTILTPGPVTDPLGGEVLVADGVDVTCKVVASKEPGAKAVDPASVKISVLGPDDKVIAEKPALLTATAGEYAANVPLTGVATGKVALRCDAASLAHAVGSSTIDTLADRGPIITLTQPTVDAPVALKVPAKFTFTALPSPIAKGDTQADVASVVMKINGIDITPTAKGAGLYEATVDLNGSKFLTKPNGKTSFTVTAQNKRSPTSAVGQATQNVNVDGTGPVITVTSPASAAIVGGTVTVAFTATDVLSGVNADSIVISIDQDDHPFNDDATNWTHTGDMFTYKFDSRLFASNTVQLPIKVTADDNVGNAATSVSLPVYLDNAGPQLDLDPLDLRTRDVSLNCSGLFDPAGNDASDDRDQGSGLDVFRVMVWDKTNEVPLSSAVRFLIGADPDSVELFFRNPNDPKALLINTKTPGSGMCNEVQDSGKQSESAGLSPLVPGGAPLGSDDKTTPPIGGCANFIPKGPPMFLCNGTSSLWQVVRHHENDLNEAAIYAYQPLANSAACTGQGWNYSNNVTSEGWVCFAARAQDKLGNVGVSPPVRLCYDDPDTVAHPGCVTDPANNPPPSCTDGCTPPARGGGYVLVQN